MVRGVLRSLPRPRGRLSLEPSDPCEPEPYESRPSIVSSGVKGRVGTRKSRQSSIYPERQILALRCSTEVHDHSIPNFAITEGSGSLGACTPE